MNVNSSAEVLEFLRKELVRWQGMSGRKTDEYSHGHVQAFNHVLDLVHELQADVEKNNSQQQGGV